MEQTQSYDDKYRVIQTIAGNPCADGYDTVTSKYSFTGRLDIQKTKHTALTKTIEYTENFVYDHRGRMLEHSMEGLPNQPKVMLASLHYNQLGELTEKQTHSVEDGGNHQPFLQKTDYLYNIWGWLTAINEPATTWEHDIFAMTLHYNDAMIGLSNPVQYSGNISSINWKTNLNQVKSAYVYSYDDLSRLTQGLHYQANDEGYYFPDGWYDEKNLTYDANGNLQTLDRNGDNNTPIDLLTYTYLNNSNQISYVNDLTGDVHEVVDYPSGNIATQGFWYDHNGNMIRSVDKGINTDILYSYLNKPELIDFGTGEKIRYIYDGAGNKLAKKVLLVDALPESSLIYAGNFVYNCNGVLQYILTGEGRLIPDNDSYRFEYFMKDHLGNTRATYAEAAPGLSQVSEYQHYYPFGVQITSLCYSSGADLPNNHLYNGKELQPEYGLQWYDYGAMFYDAELGRWHSVDPLAEKYYSFSPYIYCLSNPINRIDPDGNWAPLVIFAIKTTIGAGVDIASQVAVNMTVGGQSFGEARMNLDLTSVGSSAVTAGLAGPGMSTIAKIGVAAVSLFDALTDVSVSEGVESVAMQSKTASDATSDLFLNSLGGIASNKLEKAMKSAISSDLASGTFKTLNKSEQNVLRQTSRVVNSNATQAGVRTYINTATGATNTTVKNNIRANKTSTLAPSPLQPPSEEGWYPSEVDWYY